MFIKVFAFLSNAANPNSGDNQTAGLSDNTNRQLILTDIRSTIEGQFQHFLRPSKGHFEPKNMPIQK